MSSVNEIEKQLPAWLSSVPVPVRAVFRGVGQVFFQENALTGALFVLGIAFSSPLMALGAVIGAVLGWGTARVLKFDESETTGGIYGFNSTLVGIATLFFFQPGVVTFLLLAVGCIAAAPVTWAARRYVPFPTYTAPFIVVTWVLFFLGQALGLPRVEPGGTLDVGGSFGAIAHGISQVMFQASIWTALFFLVGIAISDWRHATLVLVGSIVGMLVASYPATFAVRALDPESLAERTLRENTVLGLYGYNATLAAVALFLSRRSLIWPLLGMLLSVPLTEFVPLLGLPALTAPFVLATWLVLGLANLERRLFVEPASPAT
jgi:urea transporter